MKRHVFVLCVLGAIFAASCSGGSGGASTPEQQFIRDVANALGGASAVQGTNTLVFESGVEGDGEAYWLGENRNPDADLPVFRTLFRWAFDWPNNRYRKEELRIAQFTSSNDQMRTISQGLDADTSYDVGLDLKSTKQPDDSARERKAELYMHPIGLIRAALSPGATIGPVTTSGGNQVTEIKTQNGSVLTLTVDSATKLPSRISTRVSHPILGDVVQEFEFSDYGKNGTNVLLPSNFVMKLDGKVMGRFRAVRQTANFDGNSPLPNATHQAFSKNIRLEVPPVVRSAKAAPRASFANDENIASAPVVAEAITPGVWNMAGGDYFSVLVEFADHLTLIEAPVDEARFNALVAKAAELVPAKKVTELVITHHHFDHLGGVRAAIAAGLTLYVRGDAPTMALSPEQGRAAPSLRSSASFFEELARRPHTIEPDALQKAPKEPVIKTVADKLVLSDATRTMELYPIDGSEYADTLLMAYLPKEKLLVESDVYTPPADQYNTLMLYPFTQNLLENIQSRKLNVERIVPLHGHIVPFDNLVKATVAVRSLPPDPTQPQ